MHFQNTENWITILKHCYQTGPEVVAIPIFSSTRPKSLSEYLKSWMGDPSATHLDNWISLWIWSCFGIWLFNFTKNMVIQFVKFYLNSRCVLALTVAKLNPSRVFILKSIFYLFFLGHHIIVVFIFFIVFILAQDWWLFDTKDIHIWIKYIFGFKTWLAGSKTNKDNNQLDWTYAYVKIKTI